MKIIDNNCMPGCPTSRFLTRAEYEGSVETNGHLPHRKNFIFKYEIPLIVDDGLGELLIKKYDTLKEVDKKKKPKQRVKKKPKKSKVKPKPVYLEEEFLPDIKEVEIEEFV